MEHKPGLAPSGVVEALQKLDRGAFPAAAFPNKGDFLTLLHSEAEVLENPLLRPRRVQEAHALKLDGVDGLKLIGQLSHSVQGGLDHALRRHHLLHGLCRCDCLGQDRKEAAKGDQPGHCNAHGEDHRDHAGFVDVVVRQEVVATEQER